MAPLALPPRVSRRIIDSLLYVNREKKRLLCFIFYLLSPIVAVYGVFLLIAALVPNVHAQDDYKRMQRDLQEERLERIEAAANGSDKNFDHRLTILEQIIKDMQENSTWFKLNMGGTGLLIVKASLEMLSTRKSKTKEDYED